MSSNSQAVHKAVSLVITKPQTVRCISELPRSRSFSLVLFPVNISVPISGLIIIHTLLLRNIGGWYLLRTRRNLRIALHPLGTSPVTYVTK